jgi:hypothetical protein
MELTEKTECQLHEINLQQIEQTAIQHLLRDSFAHLKKILSHEESYGLWNTALYFLC